MPVPTISFLFGVIVLGYLLTFVVFAILRVVTGVSIQRVGYSGFRRIAFSPRHGVKITIRGVGLSAHRPTFALPTWCSLVVTELCVTLDLRALGEKDGKSTNGSLGGANGNLGGKAADESSGGEDEGHGKLWRKLTDVKEKIKQLHVKIHWLRLVDLMLNTVEVNVVGVGSIRVERATLSVDTRHQTVDRSRLFQHHKTDPDMQKPAEWKSVIRSVLFTPEGRESTEILDYCTLNIHGLLHKQLQGLRDASIALKLGRLNVPYDDIEHAQKSAAMIRGKYAQPHGEKSATDVSLADALDEVEKPGSREERIVQTVSDSRAFIASILRGIQEVQLAVGFFGLSKKLSVQSDAGKGVYFNLAMKELGMDVLRLDPKTPAHRMYFARNDVAHQGLLTAIAISAGIDDGQDHPSRMLYVPMVTATIKTTLPSKTIHYSKTDTAGDRNSNILYANFVCTSPSIDLDPKHLPLVLGILQQQKTASQSSKPSSHGRKSNSHRIISRLLPKANIKLSIQEPVIRVSLPPMAKDFEEADYDLLISSVSSMSLELESSHSQDHHLHYGLASNYRHTSHHLYYQTAAGERHDLMHSDTVEFKVDVNAIPDAVVTASGRMQTCTVFLVRPDICEGVHQIFKQLRKNVFSQPKEKQEKQLSFLRKMPTWIEQLHFEGHDFALQLAGIDELVSKDTRGLSLELESWTTEYKAHRDDVVQSEHRRRSSSRVSMLADRSSQSPARASSPRRKKQNPADGRRLTFHLQNLDGLIIDSIDESDPHPFMSLPRFEVAFSTSTDAHGPLFHINSHAKSLLLHYSLYNHFAIGVAAMVIKKTFLNREEDRNKPKPTPKPTQSSLKVPGSPLSADEVAAKEITTIDFKAGLLQVKATMPSDPPMMLQVFRLEAGQHRWATPFFRTRLARLYVKAPATRSVWSRIVTIRVLRLDIRDIKRKTGKQTITEKSIDLATESIRIGVQHQLVVHSIFDNVINVIKTTKQLHHHFVTGTNDYVLAKEPEGPKQVPRVSVRTQIFLFEIEDSSFDWKLGAIYRAGLMEQKQRLAREDVFRIKEKRLSRGTRDTSRLRAQSTQPGERSRSRNRTSNLEKRRSRSAQPAPQTGRQNSGRRQMRYDTEGKSAISNTSQLTIEQAREKLHRLNAQTWKSRIDRVLSFQKRTMHDIRAHFMGSDEIPEETEQHEPILALTQRPGLLTIVMQDLGVTVDKPSFPMDEYPRFLHDIGKGMPHDMKYGLLLPMNLHITTGEAKFQLRDYPLPLLHVPQLANGQSPRLPSLSMQTDFVVAEEFRDIESQRDVNIVVVPKEKMGKANAEPFSVDVRRTISPVKTYSNMKFEINTSQPTKITWGTSYQPAIQDAMQAIEGFTKPPVDPSDGVGFWDKIRLSFHSRVNVAWKGDGDVHLILKGSRDPYVVTGQGAGLVMVWRNDVRWNIAQHPDPRQFMTVDSGDYILAIPDFNGYARQSEDTDNGDGSSSGSGSSYKRDAVFKKVIMKLSGNVRWLAGLMFERDLGRGERTFKFMPHYDVVLKHPDFASAPAGKEYDAYRGFRSHHIHMSIAVAAPLDRDWSVSNLKPSQNYNSVHLTPKFFSHFFSWWSMFSGVMSLPVRQGPLWGITQKKSKKFGRHIASIKYNLLFSPLFISHIYKHKDAEEYNEDTVSATGLKMKLDSFMLDLHQRREYFDIKGHDDADAKRSSGMRINQAQLDFISADLRAVSASITGTSAQEIEKATEETLASLHSQMPQVDMSKFTIPDNDFTWIDMDDFVELDWILPAESDPETKILPLGYAPRFTYFRQTDHGDSISGDVTRTSPFGDEPTHYCVMSAKNDPRVVQTELIEKRLNALRDQRSDNHRAEGEQELNVVKTRHDTEAEAASAQTKMDTLRAHGEHLKTKQHFLERMLDALTDRLESDNPAAVPELETSQEFYEAHENANRPEPETPTAENAPLADYTSDFNNRFIVHNPQIKWNNSLRNIILRYIHQNSQRRGFVYYMSRRAVKFLVDILEEQKKSGRGNSTPTRQKSWASATTPLSPEVDDEQTIQDRIDELLRDGRSFVTADEPMADREQAGGSKDHGGPNDDIAIEFTPLNTYHFRLIAPQIQLQSEKNPKAAVLVTAKGMQLKAVQIMDKDRVNDDVSGLVQRRFTAAMDSLQMFVTSTKTFSTEYLRMYSGNRYGAKAGTCWPPWVPLEMMFEFEDNPYGFNRVVHRTSASLRYDKYNTLRLKYNDDVSGGGGNGKTTNDEEESENRMDHVWLEFPQFRAICDSAQYFALYIIVMDLLLYNEPLEKTRSERLEKIMLASDFSDLTGAPEMVQMLQERIRQLEEIKMHFQVHEQYLDRQGWKDRITMDQDLASCEDELFFMMKAITTAQQRVEDRREQENAAGMLRLNMSAKEIAWHLIRDKGESLMEFQLKEASFDRTDNNDGSNTNVMEIGRINGFNLLPNALYPQIIGAYVDPSKGYNELGSSKMLRVQWLMLEAIAGIPVVDYFEVDLVPLKLQLEREVAKKLFEYIFPGVGGNAFDGGGFSPFMVKNMLPPQEEDDEEDAEKPSVDTLMAQDANNNGETITRGDNNGNGAGSLERRLAPTLHLPKQRKPKPDPKGLGISQPHHGLHGFSLFQHSDRPRSSQQVMTRSSASRSALSQTNLSAMTRSPSERSLVTRGSDAQSTENDKKKYALQQQGSTEKRKKGNERSDDLTQMMNRASNYMTLAFVKIPSVVLCLSYKGKGHRNLEDVHDLVFRMPTLEYRNKTWSNLDLALQLKKDVIRALISHAGAIVGNKFSHHKPTRQQASRLRELANSSTLLSKDGSSSHVASETSTRDHSPGEANGRPSTASGRPSTLSRSVSYGSSQSLGDSWSEERPATSGSPANGHTPRSGSQRLLEAPESLPRSRGASISRHLTGLSQRLKPTETRDTSTSNGNTDDTEENKRKSRLLLGGQKLFRTLRDQ